MRIALVNDLRIALAALAKVVGTIPGAEIAWTAEDGAVALRRCREDTPDLILMDMIMPVMDGVESTRRIMQECPCPIVVVTATVTGNSDFVFEALGHGALDAVNTPVLGTAGGMEGAADLVRKIRTVELLTSAVLPAPDRAPAAVADDRALPSGFSPLVAIGASTGGPQALAVILAAWPKPLPFSAVVVQHVDLAFAPGLADWLGREAGLPVEIVRGGETPVPGTVHIACTEDHLIVDHRGRLRYEREPADLPYRPSVDVFFESLVRTSAAPGVAVLLTGMGRDGATALGDLRRAGWHTIAQDEATSIVWGMPRAAVEYGAACATLPLEAIAPAVARRMRGAVTTSKDTRS